MSASGRDDAPPILPAPRAGHWVGVALLGILGVWVAYQIWVNPGFQWDVVGRYLFHRQVLCGVGMTLELAALVMVVGTAIGGERPADRQSGDRDAEIHLAGKCRGA